MGKRNVADGNDRVTIQVGHLLGRSPKSSKPATASSTSTNVRSGNARVGRQVDVITGNLTIRR